MTLAIAEGTRKGVMISRNNRDFVMIRDIRASLKQTQSLPSRPISYQPDDYRQINNAWIKSECETILAKTQQLKANYTWRNPTALSHDLELVSQLDRDAQDIYVQVLLLARKSRSLDQRSTTLVKNSGTHQSEADAFCDDLIEGLQAGIARCNTNAGNLDLGDPNRSQGRFWAEDEDIAVFEAWVEDAVISGNGFGTKRAGVVGVQRLQDRFPDGWHHGHQRTRRSLTAHASNLWGGDGVSFLNKKLEEFTKRIRDRNSRISAFCQLRKEAEAVRRPGLKAMPSRKQAKPKQESEEEEIEENENFEATESNDV